MEDETDESATYAPQTRKAAGRRASKRAEKTDPRMLHKQALGYALAGKCKQSKNTTQKIRKIDIQYYREKILKDKRLLPCLNSKE